jgi:hypothetical protein
MPRLLGMRFWSVPSLTARQGEEEEGRQGVLGMGLYLWAWRGQFRRHPVPPPRRVYPI